MPNSSINYALRVLRPILTGSKKTIQVKEDAELMYVDKMQTALRDRVWHSGCQSVGFPILLPWA